jgi:hypothetical protein
MLVEFTLIASDEQLQVYRHLERLCCSDASRRARKARKAFQVGGLAFWRLIHEAAHVDVGDDSDADDRGQQ